MIIGQFEELLRQSAKQPLVCGIALHTMIVGQPYRLRALREALQHIANHPQKDKVWFTRPSRHLRPLRVAAQGHDGDASLGHARPCQRRAQSSRLNGFCRIGASR